MPIPIDVPADPIAIASADDININGLRLAAIENFFIKIKMDVTKDSKIGVSIRVSVKMEIANILM